jgi:formylglycine-generating enzyme required for sulfatase activity
MELRKLYGGPKQDPEAVPDIRPAPATPIQPKSLPAPELVQAGGWPFSAEETRKRQAAAGPREKSVDLGDSVTMKLVRIPAGQFVMGDVAGEPDEYPLARVVIHKPFWMGVCEVTNEQFRRFDATHDCRYYQKRHARSDDKGLTLNDPEQPVVRVSYEQATAFCRWLSQRTGMHFTLPTEAQWEYACRAGTATPLFYGDIDADFSAWANVADKAFSWPPQQRLNWEDKEAKQVTGGLEHLVLEGAELSDTRFNDKAIVTAPVGGYRPNAWGLHDMHGNAAEWTRTAYKPYPYRDDDGRNEPTVQGRRVVRGGSFFDRPERCRSAFRLDYPAWQRIFNVGFRVVCETETRRRNALAYKSEEAVGDGK